MIKVSDFIKNTKIGDYFYTSDRKNLSSKSEYVLNKFVVVTTSIDWISVKEVKEDGSLGSYGIKVYEGDKGYFRSKKKAQNIVDSNNEILKKQRLRWNKKVSVREKNREDIENGKFDYLIGREVLVKQSSSEPWVKCRIEKVYETHKKGVVSFSQLNGNEYLTSKEGKTWKFYDRLTELEDNLVALDKEVVKEKEKLDDKIENSRELLRKEIIIEREEFKVKYMNKRNKIKKDISEFKKRNKGKTNE